MKNFSILKKEFTPDDYSKIDSRILESMIGWKVIEKYKDREVIIPGTWNSSVYPYKYFEVYKQEGDVNPSEDENEIQCYLSCGWRGMDDEVIIVLTILGNDVLSGVNEVGAEIYKFGSAPMKVYKRGKLITDFTKPNWWNKWFGKVPQLNKFIVKNVI